MVSLLVVTSGMAFSFLWLPLTQTGLYHGFWLTPADLWSSYRTAHWVGWGAYGSLYSATGAYLTFPGLAVVLAPLAVLTRAVGLTEGFPLMIPHPTAWLLLGPVEMVLGCTSLFALDALGRRLGLKDSRRRIVCAIQGFLLWPLLVLWGHPEDAIALALAIFALIGVMDRRWVHSGWLFGAAVAFQPLVLLVLPICLGRAGMRQAPRLLSRSLSPSAALLLLPFLSDWHDTWNAVVEQPQEIAFSHVTPWTSLAPRIAPGIVSGGPMRLVGILGSVVLGWYTVRRNSDDRTLVCCAALCFGLRFVTDSTLVGYYIWPALALLVLVAAAGSRSWARLISVGSLAIGLTVATARHFGPWWTWWGAAVFGLLLAALISWRPKTSSDREPVKVATPSSNSSSGDGARGPRPRVLEPAR